MHTKVNSKLFELFSAFKKIGSNVPFSNKLNLAENAIIMHMYFFSLSKKEGETVKVADINKKMEMSRAALSQHFNSLEKKGCIVRKIQSEDRRSIELEITQKGKEIQEENIKLTDEFCDIASEKMGKEKFDNLILLINEFACIVDDLNKFEEDEKLD